MTLSAYRQSMDYAPAPESQAQAKSWLESHGHHFSHYIDGQWLKAGKGETFETINPADGERLATLVNGAPGHVDKAVKAARSALKDWWKIGGEGRARHLYALARMVQKNARLFAVLEALDNGKPIRETRDIDVPLVARHFYHHAGWAQLQDTEFADYEPVGVVGQIIPWNFPLLMLSWKIAPALALGNCVVLKPAEYTPLTALLFAELAGRAGLPPGVLNVVNGDGATGAAIVSHDDVDKIAFTGSTEVGREIRSVTAGSGKSLTLELGGKSPFIVFDDADLDAAVEGVVDAIWFNQGEVCCAGSRLLVQEGIAETFFGRLKARMDKLRVGMPLDKSTDMGAIVHPVQKKRIEALIEEGRSEGATIWQPDLPVDVAEGCFYPPTLVTGIDNASILFREEIFGPVLAAMSFRTPEEAVMLANNTRYGLSASVWSETIGLALDIAPKLACGVVWINATNLFDAGVGFGGYRESGFGREGGREGVFEYIKPLAWKTRRKREDTAKAERPLTILEGGISTSVDRTAKLLIGGRQTRPDGGYSRAVPAADGSLAGEVGEGGRKDIRNAVTAALKAADWSRTTAHNRAQVLYYVAENLDARAQEFSARLSELTGQRKSRSRLEVDASISRLFSYGAWADKYEGSVHVPPLRGLALATHEAIGVVGLVCPPENPLLSFVSMLAPCIAMGNRTVCVPSEPFPLLATDFIQVLETSDVPAGVVNIVTGDSLALCRVLADHDEVDALWAFGSTELSALAERHSAGNLKRTFVDHGMAFDWFDRQNAEGPSFLRQAVQVKNIWIPFGE